jgi:hypothetical protein
MIIVDCVYNIWRFWLSHTLTRVVCSCKFDLLLVVTDWEFTSRILDDNRRDVLSGPFFPEL